MTVVADKWLAGTVQAIDDLAVQSASFRALMGTGTDTAPYTATRARGKFQDYRTSLPAPLYHLILNPGETDVQAAAKTPRHSTEVELYACWPIDNTGAADERQQALLALNAWGAVLDEVAALMNTGANLIQATMAWEPPSRTADNDRNPGCWDASITFRSVV